MALWIAHASKSSGLGQGVDKLPPDPAHTLAGGAQTDGKLFMLDYGELLRYLADNPPDSSAERRVHASMLELIATCVRDEDPEATVDPSGALSQMRARYGGFAEKSAARH